MGNVQMLPVVLTLSAEQTRLQVHHSAKEIAFTKTLKHLLVTIRELQVQAVQTAQKHKRKMIVARTKHAQMEVVQTKL